MKRLPSLTKNRGRFEYENEIGKNWIIKINAEDRAKFWFLEWNINLNYCWSSDQISLSIFMWYWYKHFGPRIGLLGTKGPHIAKWQWEFVAALLHGVRCGAMGTFSLCVHVYMAHIRFMGDHGWKVPPNSQLYWLWIDPNVEWLYRGPQRFVFLCSTTTTNSEDGEFYLFVLLLLK